MGALTDSRRAQIMGYVRERGRIAIGDLADIWRVSHETIRRDLQALEDSGDLMRVHGGAVLPNLVNERPFGERLTLNRRAKEKIADIAVKFISDEMSLFLDHSSTTVALSQRLDEYHNLTIVTNSLEVARQVGDRSSNRVVVTGGVYQPKESGLFGFDTVAQAQHYNYDIVFNGIVGISATRNLMDFERVEAELRQALVPNTRRFVILADSSKFTRTAFVQSLSFDQFSDLVTEAEPPKELNKKLKSAKINLHLPTTEQGAA